MSHLPKYVSRVKNNEILHKMSKSTAMREVKRFRSKKYCTHIIFKLTSQVTTDKKMGVIVKSQGKLMHHIVSVISRGIQIAIIIIIKGLPKE